MLVAAVANGPGALAPVLAVVADAGVNVDYAYGSAAEGTTGAAVVLGVEDAQRAASVSGIREVRRNVRLQSFQGSISNKPEIYNLKSAISCIYM